MTADYSKRTLKGILGTAKPKSPVWTGPESDGPQGGITFSLLSRFLVCKERFRLHTIEGLHTKEKFNHKIEYGNMWHKCEEEYAKPFDSAPMPWESALLEYCKTLCKKYPHQQDEIDKWYNICKVQFPIYVDYWQNNEAVKGRTPLLQEQVFHVPYTLPSRRVVWLRGKWDSVDLISLKSVPSESKFQGKHGGIYLQENKTKGKINPVKMRRQLRYDLQTMLYLVALHEKPSCDLPREGFYRNSDAKEYPILGVRYNVIRRPLSGGTGTIVRHKRTANKAEETKSHFYARLATIIEGDKANFFMRWTVDVTPQDIAKFKRECLDPVLEQLCSWYEIISSGADPFQSVDSDDKTPLHYRHPFGVWNPLDEDGASDLDEYLETSSMVGLDYNNNLFPELT